MSQAMRYQEVEGIEYIHGLHASRKPALRSLAVDAHRRIRLPAISWNAASEAAAARQRSAIRSSDPRQFSVTPCIVHGLTVARWALLLR